MRKCKRTFLQSSPIAQLAKCPLDKVQAKLFCEDKVFVELQVVELFSWLKKVIFLFVI